MTRALALLLFAGCGPDPCATDGATTLELGGADLGGQGFDAFADGADRELVRGPQGGMHVWMQARVTNVCPDTAEMERRAVDDATDEVYFYERGPVDFFEVEPGLHQLPTALRMILCPPPRGLPVLDHPMRFVAAVSDDQGNRAETELSFVPRCPAGMDCTALCAP